MAEVEFACPECGGRFLVDSIDIGAEVVCPHCQKQVRTAAPAAPPAAPTAPGVPPPPKPPSYLVQSILVLFCCCQPLGIVALIFAAQVDSKYSAGDYRVAMDYSDKAKLFAWLGFAIGLVFYCIAIVFQVAAASAGRY